jgi:hypothetical protein
MMNYIYTHQIEILLASNAILIAAASIAVSRFCRLVRRNEAFWGSPVGAQLIEKQEPDAVLCGFLDHRLRLLQDEILRRVGQRETEKPEPGPVAAKPAAMPFEYAARMARQGAGVDDLVRACGLSRAEAGLIHRVHGRHRGEEIAA